MTDDFIDALWPERPGAWSVEALAELCGLTAADVRELVEYGALLPEDPAAAQWTFGSHCVVIVQTAVRLRRDFDLDPPGLALALTLVERIRTLEDEIRRLQVLIPRRMS